MRPLRAFLLRVAGLLHRDRGEHELTEELRAHLEMCVEDNLRAGMSPAEARRTALMDSGGLGLAADACRERRAIPWASNLLQDARYALRKLRHSPGFTLVATLTLALGIGANTAIFSVVNAAMLQRLPFQEPDRLVMVWERSPRSLKPNVVNPLNFLEWRDRNHSFERIAAFVETAASLTGDGEPEQIHRLIVSDGFFKLVDVKPVLGRWFTPDEDLPDAKEVVILSYELWQRRYGGDPNILGRTIQMNQKPRTIVGVMPPGFRFPQTRADLWQPFGMSRTNVIGEGRYLSTLARLRPGASIASARADMNVLASALQKEHAELDSKWGATVVSLREQTVGDMRTPLLVLLGAVGLVLLIACANVANLMLMRCRPGTRDCDTRRTGRGRVAHRPPIAGGERDDRTARRYRRTAHRNLGDARADGRLAGHHYVFHHQADSHRHHGASVHHRGVNGHRNSIRSGARHQSSALRSAAGAAR